MSAVASYLSIVTYTELDERKQLLTWDSEGREGASMEPPRCTETSIMILFNNRMLYYSIHASQSPN